MQQHTYVPQGRRHVANTIIGVLGAYFISELWLLREGPLKALPTLHKNWSQNKRPPFPKSYLNFLSSDYINDEIFCFYCPSSLFKYSNHHCLMFKSIINPGRVQFSPCPNFCNTFYVSQMVCLGNSRLVCFPDSLKRIHLSLLR